MKRIFNYIIAAVIIMVSMASCSETETYAEQKDRERSAINSYIAKNGIKIISEETFKAQGESTNVEENEYVFFKSTGLYMQIVDKGIGEKVKEGTSTDLLCRYKEYNINSDSLQLTNIGNTYPDKITVYNSSGTFNARFSDNSVMSSVYGSTQVPSGWLTPLTYIMPGRNNAEGRDATVKIIVPHDKGHSYATSNVYACHYELTYLTAE